MTNQVSDPISNNVERVLVRNTATGFEQGIAATAGFLTAGPLGALASWGVIRGVQGKWTPWVILGIPAAPVLGLIQLFTIGAIAGAGAPDAPVSAPDVRPTGAEQVYNDPSRTALPSYNVSNSGGTTLQQKCVALKGAQDRLDLTEIASLSFQIGFDHDTPVSTSVDEDCQSVGVYAF